MSRACAAALLFGLVPSSIVAQERPSTTLVAAAAVAAACKGRAGSDIPAADLALAIYVAAQVSPTEYLSLAGGAAAGTIEQQALARLHAIDNSVDPQTMPGLVRSSLERLLVRGIDVGQQLAAQRLPGDTLTNWLFDPARPHVLRCAAATATADRIVTSSASRESFPSRIKLRGSVEDLRLATKEIGGTAGVALNYGDSRVRDADGSVKRTRSFDIDGTLGIRLIPDTDQFAFAYADYTLARTRVRADGVISGRADDIDALELGLAASVRTKVMQASYGFRLTARAGAIIDSVNDARRLTAGATLDTVGVRSLGPLCGFNYLAPSFFFNQRMRCTLGLELDASHVLRPGRLELRDSDELLAVGPVAGIEIAPPLDDANEETDGVVGFVTYRYLASIAGGVRDLHRLDAALKYRWWVGDTGIDFGLTFTDGIERKSLSSRRQFGVSFGIIR